jgi:hypothetical protein
MRWLLIVLLLAAPLWPATAQKPPASNAPGRELQRRVPAGESWGMPTTGFMERFNEVARATNMRIRVDGLLCDVTARVRCEASFGALPGLVTASTAEDRVDKVSFTARGGQGVGQDALEAFRVLSVWAEPSATDAEHRILFTALFGPNADLTRGRDARLRDTVVSVSPMPLGALFLFERRPR